MGNSCCEGRANKVTGSLTPQNIQRKPTIINSKLKRDRTKSFKRSASFLGRGSRSINRNPSNPESSAKQQLKPIQEREETNLRSQKSTELEEPSSVPFKSLKEGEIALEDRLPTLGEEDERLEDGLDLEYILEEGRACSQTQQKQLLALFEMDEELDGLVNVSLLNGKDKFEVLVMAISSKCLYLLSSFDFSEVKCKIYLRYLRLLGLNSDRTAVALVFKRGVEGLEHVVLSSTKYESLLKAIVNVYYDETGKVLPAVTHPTIADTEDYISHLTWSTLCELTSPEALRVQRLFVTKGQIGEIKLLHVQCLKSIQDSERAVQLLVSDRALYTISYSFILIDKVPLETVKAVRFSDPTHVCIVADTEHNFNLQSTQGHVLEEAISAYMRRSTM